MEFDEKINRAFEKGFSVNLNFTRAQKFISSEAKKYQEAIDKVNEKIASKETKSKSDDEELELV